MTTAPVMSVTEELLKDLEDAARAATPGPWCVDDEQDHDEISVIMGSAVGSPGEYYTSHKWSCESEWCDEDDVAKANAQHIAAANPATVLALIARVRQLEKDESKNKFYASLYHKSSPMWHRLHDLAVSKGYDHVRYAIECAQVYRCDCMGARKVAIDLKGNTLPCECVNAAND